MIDTMLFIGFCWFVFSIPVLTVKALIKGLKSK